MADNVEKDQILDQKIEELIDTKLDGYMKEIKRLIEKRYPEPAQKLTHEPKIEYIGERSPKNKYDKFAAPYKTAEPDQQFRFIYGHPEVLPLRKQDGWKPVLDKDGSEVRFGDHILAKMSKKEYEVEVVAPVKQSIAHKRQMQANRLEQGMDELRSDIKKGDARISGYYDVKYDNEEGTE